MTRKQVAEKPVARKKSLRSAVVDQPTRHALPVAEVLDVLQAQAKDAMPGPISDDAPTTKMTPMPVIVKCAPAVMSLGKARTV